MFSSTVEPGFFETDALGHINNTAIPCWLETARNPIFRLFTPDLDLRKWRLILVNMHIDFLAQVFYGQHVALQTGIIKVGNSSFIIGQHILQQETLCVNCKATLIHFDFARQKSVPIPAEIREQLSKHLIDPF